VIGAAVVLATTFLFALVTGALAGPNWYGARLVLLMSVAGFIGGTIALLPIIAWRL